MSKQIREEVEQKVLEQEEPVQPIQPKVKTKKATPKVDFAAEFLKEIAGKFVTFYLNPQTQGGVDMVEGVPMCVIQDPNGRYIVKFFENEGSRAFLYLDQISVFSTQDSPGQITETENLEGQGGYNQPLGDQLPDGIQPPNQHSRRGGFGTVQSGPISVVPRVPRK